MASKHFHVVDYVVCLAVLALSLCIGLFYAKKGQKSTGEYFMGDRKMNVIPVATSMAVTYLSAITMLGFPAELYYYGVIYWLYIAGRVLGFVGASYTFVPLMYPLKITSANEYLKMRFQSRPLVVFGSILQIASVIVTAGAVLYGPAILFEAVSVIPPWACMLMSGLISTLYTTLGGYKGVIATDVFQAIIMMGGLLTVLITGLVKAGGSGRVWQMYSEGGRLSIKSFVDPFSHSDVLSMIVCAAMLDIYGCGVMQAGFQRHSSVPTLKDAQKMFLMAIPPMVVMSSIACITGVVAYAYYSGLGCDPLAAGYIKSANGIIPYLVMEILGYPGLPGIFISACLCGALSNLSSTLNAAAALAWEDFISKMYTDVSDRRKTQITKLTAACFGLLAIAFGFLAMNLPGTIIKVTLGLCGASVTPLGLLFLIGAIQPRANWKNAMVTSVTVLIALCTITIGSAFVRHPSMMLPLTTTNCTSDTYPSALNESVFHLTANQTQFSVIQESPDNLASYVNKANTTSATKGDHNEVTGFMRIFHINGLWNVMLGTVFGLVLSIILSFIPGFCSSTAVHPSLLFPFLRKSEGDFEYDVKKNGLLHQTGTPIYNGDSGYKISQLPKVNNVGAEESETKEKLVGITSVM